MARDRLLPRAIVSEYRGPDDVDDPTTESPERAQTELDIQANARAAAAVGQVISGRYRVDDLLAMGGMGAVYRGTHLLLRSCTRGRRTCPSS